MSRRGFTLIEMLVVVAIMAVLVAVLIPTLAGARESGRSARCLSNLKQAALICALYADDHRSVGPALGVPYAAIPNWALVVLDGAGRAGTGAEMYAEATVLVCPTTRARSGESITRAYAMNATGHARDPSDPLRCDDPDNYDAEQAHVRYFLVDAARAGPILVDSLPQSPSPGSPPPTRTASVLDFRQAAHVTERLATMHGGNATNHANYDGSAGSTTIGRQPIPDRWRAPLP